MISKWYWLIFECINLRLIKVIEIKWKGINIIGLLINDHSICNFKFKVIKYMDIRSLSSYSRLNITFTDHTIEK